MKTDFIVLQDIPSFQLSIFPPFSFKFEALYLVYPFILKTWYKIVQRSYANLKPP